MAGETVITIFGNKQPNRTGTHWIVFIKEDTE